MRISGKFLTVPLLILLGGLVLCTRYYRLNIEPSVPLGLYRLHAVPEVLERGQLVVLPVPESLRDWKRLPLLKPVAAVAGESVCLSAVGGVFVLDAVQGPAVRGVYYGNIWREVEGKPLPQQPEGCFTLRQGTVFLASDHPKSIDSRYFGPVPLTSLVAVATSVVVWK